MKSPAYRSFTQTFIQAQIKENIKTARHWPLWGEFTGDRWLPRTKGKWRGKCFHFMTSSGYVCLNKISVRLYLKHTCTYLHTIHPHIHNSLDGIHMWWILFEHENSNSIDISVVVAIYSLQVNHHYNNLFMKSVFSIHICRTAVLRTVMTMVVFIQ